MKYHMRRLDRVITDPDKLERILKETRYITIAMCKDNIPYLVSLSHAYDPDGKRLYFHCASEGKKLDYMRANPHIWGQAIIDHGYVEGKCNHLYVTAMFEGTVHFAETTAEKRRIMSYMFTNQEKPSPNGEVDPHMIRIGKDVEIGRTTIGWISVEELTGKKSAEVNF
jgi:nitroimidazol reductase NimA-like FMN-containing flavoprotein (pyridoxamine 5'-phosphate oxidase superfamily)